MAPTPLDTRDQAVWSTVARFNNLLADRVDDTLSSTHGISLTDYELLAFIAGSEGRRARMSDLADHLVLSRSNLSHRVARLEERGLVKRTGVPRGRGVEASLTRSGTALLKKASATHGEAVRGHLGVLTRKERAELQRLLAAVVSSLAPG